MIKPVKYAPDLKRNLLSIGMLDKSGYDIKINYRQRKVVNGSF